MGVKEIESRPPSPQAREIAVNGQFHVPAIEGSAGLDYNQQRTRSTDRPVRYRPGPATNPSR